MTTDRETERREMAVMLQLMLQIIFCCLLALPSKGNLTMNPPGCQSKCGNINISYPFGIGDSSCFRNQQFNLTCNDTFTPPKLFLRNVEILDISLLGQFTIRSGIGWDCYPRLDDSYYRPYWIELDEDAPFTISSTLNRLIALGCDTWTTLTAGSRPGDSFTSGCISYCEDEARVINGSCAGSGCCQSPIPEGLKSIYMNIGSFKNHTKVLDFNRCGYCFLVDLQRFVFSRSDLEGTNFLEWSDNMPVAIDWGAGKETCEKAKANKETYACLSENSHCYNPSNGPGYRCSCSSGYHGNPYIKGGCIDIDECQDQNKKPCKGICINTIGNYSCTCPKGTHGDPSKGGDGCVEDSKEFPVLKVFLGIGVSLMILLIGSIWTFWAWKEREMIRLKEKFFQQNGGMLLEQKISSHRTKSFKIFKAKELEIATENYSYRRIVGQGSYGVVYKGILPDHKIVAIKKSKVVDTSQIEQFINEIDILSQINHRNVVKVLGCCLEDQVPLLVYEFVSYGTLYSHIHKTGHIQSISFQNRLRIAVETAEALAYLHSAASIPIFHRDVKSSNILLDDNLTAKVSDFGASRLVPIDQTQITTLVQGTLGYLDPEYFQTSQLTAKSDVYSFGVVLVELLTGEKPICLNRSPEERNLAMHFISAMKENRMFQILEDQVLAEGQEAQLVAIGKLVERCLKVKGEERPSMKEVAIELQRLRGFQDYPSVSNYIKETDNLLDKTTQSCSGEASGQYIENHILSKLKDGR